MMETRAVARFVRIAHRKARAVADLVRNRSAAEAQTILTHTPKAGAKIVAGLLDSAVANARQREPNLDLDSLYVKTIYVDKGPMWHMRRWRPRAMGRATRIAKGVSHITLVLEVRS
jgi:large subunit ribosomal protein L22